MKYLSALLLILYAACAHSQQLDTSIVFSTSTSAIRIFQDLRIHLLTEEPATPRTATMTKARGYRIQIYSGTDRQKAQDIRQAFMQEHHGISAYLVYNRPHFRVRVGDFLTRKAAGALYDSLQDQYICIIVPTIINIKQ